MLTYGKAQHGAPSPHQGSTHFFLILLAREREACGSRGGICTEWGKMALSAALPAGANSSLVTVPDSYPLPNKLDFTSSRTGCRYFSKIDLRKGKHQMPMLEAQFPKFNLFNSPPLPFGFCNEENTFL
jgi:hypothetical protein